MLALIIANLAMIGVAVAQYSQFFLQPGAHIIVLGSVSALIAYTIAAVWVGRTRGPDWDAIVRRATLFGVLGGTGEALNIAIENGILRAIHIPALPLVFMLTIFASWGVASFRAARGRNSVRAGLLTAIASAAICMLIGVAAGFVIEFFGARPDPAYVATWGEFKRSGWTDARAFGLANTLDSGFTHLVIAPIVALVVGGLGSLLARIAYSKEDSIPRAGHSES